MDRIRPRLGLLIFAAALIAAQDQPQHRVHNFPILAARWLTPSHYVRGLTTQPRECAHIPNDPVDRMKFQAGRAAFRAPLLLGGQAARAGLSCESCHSNGHRNSLFQFPGLSDAPGTADVTSSLMSSRRGNAVFDPKPIPDLALPGKISRDPQTRALETFIHGLIVEEFDGPEPPPAILEDVAFYVRSLNIPLCSADTTEPIRLADALDDASAAAIAADQAWRRGDGPAARLLLSSVRSILGRIDERYTQPGLNADRQGLRNADLELLAIEQAMDRGDPTVLTRIAVWRSGVSRWSTPLRRDEDHSLYDPAMFARVLR